MATPITRYGITLSPPRGWDAVIYRRPPGRGETTQAVVHAGSFPLPQVRGDYGSGAVELMRSGDVFLSLLEFEPASSGQALFASRARPAALTPADFSPDALQRSLPGQAGLQRFFAENGRAFCLYVVLAGFRGAAALLSPINQTIGALQIASAGG